MRRKIGLLVLAVLLAVLAALLFWQRNNLQAIYLYLTLDEEAVGQQADDTRQQHQQSLEEKHHVTIRPIDRQQSDDLLDGKVKPEEVKQALGISATPAAPTEKKKTAEELVNECVAELYACKVDLMGTLGEMKQEIVNTWNGLNPTQRTIAKRTELGMAALDECYELEVVIDDRVETILNKYRPLLKEAGGDLTVLDELWRYYCEEKAAEKAYYLNKYL